MGNYLCGCCQIKNFQSIILQLFRVIMAVLQQSVLTKQLSTKATGKHSIAEILTYLVKTYFCDLIIFKHFSVIHFRVLALLKAYKVILFRGFGPIPRNQGNKISQGNSCFSFYNSILNISLQFGFILFSRNAYVMKIRFHAHAGHNCNY